MNKELGYKVNTQIMMNKEPADLGYKVNILIAINRILIKMNKLLDEENTPTMISLEKATILNTLDNTVKTLHSV